MEDGCHFQERNVIQFSIQQQFQLASQNNRGAGLLFYNIQVKYQNILKILFNFLDKDLAALKNPSLRKTHQGLLCVPQNLRA